MTSRSLDVAIVGYGIAGIAAAIRLRRQGHRIVHFDRNDPPLAHGAGMLLHPPAIRELERIGVAAEAIACGATVRRICAQTVSGRRLMDIGYADVGAGEVGLGIQRGTLHRLLASADSGRDQVCTGREIISLDPDRGYLMEKSGVRHGPFGLIVIADGIHSLLRRVVSPSTRYQQRANSAALVGLLDDPGGLAADCLMQYFDRTRHLSIWPVGRESLADDPRCSFAINIPLAQAAAFRDSGEWRTLLARLCPSVGKLVDERVENSSLHIFTYRNVELSQCAVGRTVVIGDAAHSMSPQLGNGAQLAMEDAAILTAAIDLHDELPHALQAYAMTRPRQLRRYHRISRWLTPLFQSNNRALAAFRDYLFANTMHLPYAKRFARSLLC